MINKHRAFFTWTGWVLLLALCTALLILVRSELDKAHVTLLFLLIVLGGSAGGGRTLGVTLSITAFLLFNWFFLPPYHTLTLANSMDWLILLAFLVTSLVAAQLLYRARAERKAAEMAEALRQADKLKDALLASVSHDLRTPLTTIKGLAHEMVEVDDRALVIEEEADRLNKMVTDLLDLARLNGGALPLSMEINAVDDLLGALAQQFSGLADRHRLHLHLKAPDGVLLGRFDFVHSLRILSNLVSNAFKYAPVDTDVDVTAWEEGDKIMIAVEDHGPGMPSEEPTTGYGLSIARRLAEAQQGSLEYHPRHPRSEGGSVFLLTLPKSL